MTLQNTNPYGLPEIDGDALRQWDRVQRAKAYEARRKALSDDLDAKAYEQVIWLRNCADDHEDAGRDYVANRLRQAAEAIEFDLETEGKRAILQRIQKAVRGEAS